MKESGKKFKILIFVDWYLPGYKAGGPIKSIAALVSNLKSEFDFYIITSDTDAGDLQPYEGIKSDCWIKSEGSVNIFYASQKFLTWKNLLKVTKSIDFDIVYLNSFFSKYFSIYPLLFKKLKYIDKPIILAPRGMLGDGALGIKNKKKKLFISISKKLGLHGTIFWHATAQSEYNEIRNIYGQYAKITIAPNIQFKTTDIFIPTIAFKERGYLKLFFLSRISEKKNLLYALEILDQLKLENQQIDFDIIGPIEDQKYWNKCLQEIATLNSTIKVNYIGSILNSKISESISQYHFLFLPTRNENYGHAIVESLMNGKPVIISDQTPWQNLKENKAGWDIELNETTSFLNAIKDCVNMDQETYSKWSKAAHDYIVERTNPEEGMNQNRRLLYQAIGKNE